MKVSVKTIENVEAETESENKISNGKKMNKRSIVMDTPFYLMLLPAIVLVFLFNYLPLMGIVLAFKENDLSNGFFGGAWASHGGFGNFVTLFQTPEMVEAILNTLLYNTLGLIFSFPAPILFALLLNEITNKIFKRVAQSLSYLPHFLSWISVTALFTSLLATDGPLNDLIVAFGGDRNAFLENEGNFIPIYLLLSIWKDVGWSSIIFLANISSIDPQLYEAAKMDGAGRVNQAVHITLPALIPTIMILLILQLGRMFSSNFDLMYGLQSPYFTDEVISTVVYKQGLQQGIIQLRRL